jgi:3-hydroxybutyryl-CoA dehydrogenase
MGKYDVKKVAVVGAGVMGAGIAQVFAQQGFPVVLNDLNDDILGAAKKRIGDTLALLQSHGILAQEKIEAALKNVTFSSGMDALSNVDLVVEAIPEKIELKQSLFKELAGRVSPEVILASNTSGISISSIASVAKKPDRIIGMHWWNPPYIIPVIEIIKGEKTDEGVVEAVRKLVMGLNKKPVLVKKDVPGFLGNRMQYALMREAVHLLEAGVASAEDIDTMVKAGFGFKFPVIGPLETIDMAGMDIFYNVSRYLYGELDGSKEPQKLVEEKFNEKKLGMKTGEGFYDYRNIDVKSLNQERVGKYIRLLKDLGYSQK